MECRDCKFCYKDYEAGAMIWYCCSDGHMNYTPGLIYGRKPLWCPFEKNEDDIKHEHQDSKQDLY